MVQKCKLLLSHCLDSYVYEMLIRRQFFVFWPIITKSTSCQAVQASLAKIVSHPSRVDTGLASLIALPCNIYDVTTLVLLKCWSTQPGGIHVSQLLWTM